ncbi:uncharacterized protein LOC119102203 [Pollicipes pollicipes]|uniref:uncharacterized protein LOC119102203 n=1 Tax=Pollicipes pollicipes TaxID=41117 RepID=UPI001884A2C7|nr:uncharacterized protein LOC119102203 [Pollicipes pollicipes]XP_037081449.1 uncharacterized protein LOC119102203 [Pollicipes pollicipes]XP_037081450.1 uncharacterized protein LOC119102203 [Pollicipes pollicipes]XP_037081451.1 uncharacterized protein LOC119102203 [Pollicipes pollicipes]XP_037081452.1 uncharacterized protein LOC119102203 [Pollicipes pollicipes]
MGLINDELEEVRKMCQNVVLDSKLITCVPAMVRIEIRKTDFKQLAACFQFPSEYPRQIILLELKSKTLSDKLLEGLVKICEAEAKKLLGKPQILPLAKFVSRFLDENPLSCCSAELSRVRREALADGDELKLKQKTSTVSLSLRCQQYHYRAHLVVPADYPRERVAVEERSCNLPGPLRRWLTGQAGELARCCVEPPLRPPRNAPPFEPRPSLEPVVRFLATDFRRFPTDVCQHCKKVALPADPADVVEDGGADLHVERVYCGHLYHFGCLVQYMKTPPFDGGKKCEFCGKRIFHDKYKVSPQLAEARWAQEQARERELGEVIDFLS